MFLSLANFGRHSKRIFVTLLSSAQTERTLYRTKSPAKANFRMALRKHDPHVNRHVIYYETKINQRNLNFLNFMNTRYARLTGKGAFKSLVGRIKKNTGLGNLFPYWNERAHKGM